MSNPFTENIASHVVLILFVLLGIPASVDSKELFYTVSQPPLYIEFAQIHGHYSGIVNHGNLILQSDIPDAPLIRWKNASAGKFYTLMMLDFDGNATGSYPDPVAPGPNAPLRHWIVGNIPGELLGGEGYLETKSKLITKKITVVQAYRAPHVPVVSDRYGLYLFEQKNEIRFAKISGTIMNYDYSKFIAEYKLGEPKASNYFVGLYTSESPFTGQPFHGNDVSKIWLHKTGKGKLTPTVN